MREIKFRAWDGERLKEVNSIGWVDGELDRIDTPKYNGPVDEDVEIMQYTGLDDVDGVGIYEGDIVKVSDGNFHYVSEVVWCGNEPNWNYPAFDLNGMYIPSEWEYESNALQSEVLSNNLIIIGNIYENLELLEEVQE